MLIDKSTSFGVQNFFVVTQDESDGTYNYYGYLTRKGSILLMRTNKDVTEILYYLTKGTFSTVWAAKGDYTYVLPTAFVDQKL